jgi:hypothetical protein
MNCKNKFFKLFSILNEGIQWKLIFGFALDCHRSILSLFVLGQLLTVLCFDEFSGLFFSVLDEYIQPKFDLHVRLFLE